MGLGWEAMDAAVGWAGLAIVVAVPALILGLLAAFIRDDFWTTLGEWLWFWW
jgi:hypothetical protein